VNYGRVSLGGLDLSLGYLLSSRVWGELRFSYLGRRAFYNPLTRSKDPINAPQYKLSAGATYTSRHNRFWCSLNTRYVPSFDWSAGIFIGTIPSYAVCDLSLGYRPDESHTFKLTVNNLNNQAHREIIGGAKLGRQIILNLSVKL